MKLGKKFAVLSILILAIGLVTVLSLIYFTDNNMIATGQIIPWFGADIPYAYVNLYTAGGNNTMTWDGAYINGVLNFTLTPNAVDLVGAVAQIEFYRLHFYSDQGSIINMTYSVAVSGKVADPNSSIGFDYAITGSSGGNIYQFIDGTVFDGSVLFGQGYGSTVICNNMPEIPLEREYTVTVLSVALLDCFGEKDIQAVNKLRNAQTLSVDISRIGAVTYQGSQEKQSSTNILLSDDLLYTIEFTKIEGGFVCGTYKDSVPFQIQVPNATPTPPMSQPFEESPFVTVYELQPPPF